MLRTSRGNFNPTQVSGRLKRTLSGIIAALLLLGVSSCGGASHEGQTQAGATAPVHIARSRALHYDTSPRILKLKHPIPTVRSVKGQSEITPRGITLHWWAFSSDGDIEGLRRELRRNKACGVAQGCSVQFGITEDGKTYQMMRSPIAFARHARGANDTTIGIEIEGGPQDFATPGKKGFNQKKFEAVVSLTAKLAKDYAIPLDGKVVCDHVVGVHSHHEYNKCRSHSDKTDVGAAYTKAVKVAIKSM